MGTPPTDTVSDNDSYLEFYEQLGERYPETELVHRFRGKGSRYWTILSELREFAMTGCSMLDLGCNNGVYTIPYCLGGGRAIGVDISTSLVRKASERAINVGLGKNRWGFIQGEIDSPSLVSKLDEQFDVTLLSEVLEHMLNPDVAIKNIHTLTKTGGVLVLSTPTPLFEDLAILNLQYAIRLLSSRKLYERHLIDTTRVEVLSKHGVSPFLYRHDGYYPLALKKQIENFGFHCERLYTINFAHRRRMGLSLLRLVGADPEISARRIPIIRFFGGTNIAIFRKKA